MVGVPRDQAMRWLRASGCGGLFVRPFYTKDTSPELERGRFALLWARGADPSKAASLWDTIHDLKGVVGLVLSARDVAVRVTAEADTAHIEAQLREVCDQNARLHKPVADAGWWCLQRLDEQELWRVNDMIAQTGLKALGEVARAKMGPRMWKVFFRAVGKPSRRNLDDGTWSSSAAVLVEAQPPMKRHVGGGVALSASSTWAGARAAAEVETSPPRQVLPAAAKWGGLSLDTVPAGHKAPAVLLRPKVVTAPVASDGYVHQPTAAPKARRRSGGGNHRNATEQARSTDSSRDSIDAMPVVATSAFSPDDRAVLRQVAEQGMRLEALNRQQAEVIE